MSDALIINEVCKTFGSFTAVDRFSLRLPAGQVLGFLGPNGAGKTTTLRMVMSIMHPDSGDICVLGHPRASEVKDRIGYLPEERGLYRKMTVEKTLRYFGKLKGLGGGLLSARIDEGLARVGLSEWRNKRVETLSKGMSQKLQFVSTLLHKPELVILDEPFSGLDPINVDLLQRLLVELRDEGATVVFSTHQMEQAERLCDRIVLINHGRKLLDGTMSEIRARYHTRFLVFEGEGDFAALARLEGVVDAQVADGQARLELTDETEPHAVLSSAMHTLRITRFEIQRPSLQEIFVKLVSLDEQAHRSNDAGDVNARQALQGV